MNTTTRFSVFLANMGYWAQEEFSTVEDAIACGRAKGFEFAVFSHDGPRQYKGQDQSHVASWTVFGGLQVQS